MSGTVGRAAQFLLPGSSVNNPFETRGIETQMPGEMQPGPKKISRSAVRHQRNLPSKGQNRDDRNFSTPRVIVIGGEPSTYRHKLPLLDTREPFGCGSQEAGRKR